MPATGSDLGGAGARLTLRLRLTLLYGGCFLVAGAALLGITYGLVAHHVSAQEHALIIRGGKITAASPPVGAGFVETLNRGRGAAAAPVEPTLNTRAGRGRQRSGSPGGFAAVGLSQLKRSSQKQLNSVVNQANVALSLQLSQSLTALLTWSGIALAIMALASIGLGWILAGRALRPLRTMNLRAREITEDSLHARLGLDGRRDELGELAATFDGLLGRLERAFDAQRRFVATASHELRTPVTLERALVEVALADPDASAESLRRTCERVLAAGEQQERVIEGLLALARGQAGIERRERVDLAELLEDALAARESRSRGLAVETVLEPAVVGGDPALLERLVANLLDNAIVHNAPERGWIQVATGTTGGRAELRVANAGRVIAPERLPELFEPFRRLDDERLVRGEGLGLGLSIVRAIAVAHGADIDVHPVAAGGLAFLVRFPPAPTAPAGAVSRAPADNLAQLQG